MYRYSKEELSYLEGSLVMDDVENWREEVKKEYDNLSQVCPEFAGTYP